MEAWLSVPIRLIGVALLVAFIYLSFDGVRQDLVSALPNAVSVHVEPKAAPIRDARIPLILYGICIVAFLVFSFERSKTRRFEIVVAQVEAFEGSIYFDPPASTPSRQYNARIVTVDLSDTNVSDELFPDLDHIPNLKVVRLANTRIGADAMRTIASCQKLERIDLSQTPLTSSDIAPLAMHQTLQCLIANDTQIDDDAIATLCSCEGLLQIEAQNTCLSDEGIQRLATGLPMAKISVASVAT